jgi:hypothetical protein
MNRHLNNERQEYKIGHIKGRHYREVRVNEESKGG